MKESEKLGKKQLSQVTLHFVLGHSSRKQTVEADLTTAFWLWVSSEFSQQGSLHDSHRLESCAQYCILGTL